ncbi:hypothetical protein B0H15DRAFT_2114 [Mycena belliarum]|uniref:Uncharacterized protein n=1 Tax=Mycena belliarum TaxID=1033014 RepID=A0AAD6UPZ7_9AGAR|nr:hypothetical protein B0H15DRAFT_2114 [Mycena belliae]
MLLERHRDPRGQVAALVRLGGILLACGEWGRRLLLGDGRASPLLDMAGRGKLLGLLRRWRRSGAVLEVEILEAGETEGFLRRREAVAGSRGHAERHSTWIHKAKELARLLCSKSNESNLHLTFTPARPDPHALCDHAPSSGCFLPYQASSTTQQINPTSSIPNKPISYSNVLGDLRKKKTQVARSITAIGVLSATIAAIGSASALSPLSRR